MNLIDVSKTQLFNDLLDDWWDVYSKEDIRMLGKIQRYDIICMKQYKDFIAIYDPINKKYAGFVDMEREGRSHCISRAANAKDYQGLGLMTKLYVFLILNKNYVLWSQSSQSKGGKSIWEKLCKVKGINVFAWDIKRNKAYQIEPDEPFDEQDIYATEIDKLYIKKSSLENKINSLKSKLLDLLREIHMENNTDISKKRLAIQYHKQLKVMESELPKIGEEVEDLEDTQNNITLVAQRG